MPAVTQDQNLQGIQFTTNSAGQVVVANPTTPDVGASGNGGGGGGSSSNTSTAPVGPTDYSSVLGIYGLPSDVQAKVSQIFASTTDVNQATALALAYIRGTQWYAQTYPGIQEGISNGTINNEAGYRQYLNQINQLNQQYYGTDITSQQVADYLKAGYSPSHVQNLFQGHAYAQANGQDLRYLTGAFGGGQISDQNLETLGQENAGIDSTLGQSLQLAVNKAQARLQKVFSGSIATPSLSLGTNGLSSPSLAGQKSTPDVAA